jgi:hypothetical protein
MAGICNCVSEDDLGIEEDSLELSVLPSKNGKVSDLMQR